MANLQIVLRPGQPVVYNHVAARDAARGYDAASDFRFKVGQRVWYRMSFGRGPEYPAIVINRGHEGDDPVYDVRLDYEGAKMPGRWGYTGQLRTRDSDPQAIAEERAYAEGWHSVRLGGHNPYLDFALSEAWERGRRAAKQQRKMVGHYFQGEIRGRRFEPPTKR